MPAILRPVSREARQVAEETSSTLKAFGALGVLRNDGAAAERRSILRRVGVEIGGSGRRLLAHRAPRRACR